MAIHTTQTCDACGVDVTERGTRNGLVVTVGYSRGGWGHRRDKVNWQGEVCKACFDSIGESTAAFFRRQMEKRSEAPFEVELPKPVLPKAKARQERRMGPVQRFVARLIRGRLPF